MASPPTESYTYKLPISAAGTLQWKDRTAAYSRVVTIDCTDWLATLGSGITISSVSLTTNEAVTASGVGRATGNKGFVFTVTGGVSTDLVFALTLSNSRVEVVTLSLPVAAATSDHQTTNAHISHGEQSEVMPVALLLESGDAAAKTSALSAATTLAGTETVPVVQSGATKKATVASIAALASAAVLVESGTATKTSALTSATTLAGTEVLPIVQGGTTKKVAASAIAGLAAAAVLVESGAATKTSAFGAAATITGTESVMIVQDGANVKVALSVLKAYFTAE